MSQTTSKDKVRNYIRGNTKELYDRIGGFNFANVLHNLYTQFDSAEMILEVTRFGEMYPISAAQLNQSKILFHLMFD